mmetsp:Transcript_6338/g.5738  ORF Transcript_6338/g.5738 Transcript_6338/m.5738 type:complete len:82 (-) Transcript_6338:257-502(-)
MKNFFNKAKGFVKSIKQDISDTAKEVKDQTVEYKDKLTKNMKKKNKEKVLTRKHRSYFVYDALDSPKLSYLFECMDIVKEV